MIEHSSRHDRVDESAPVPECKGNGASKSQESRRPLHLALTHDHGVRIDFPALRRDGRPHYEGMILYLKPRGKNLNQKPKGEHHPKKHGYELAPELLSRRIWCADWQLDGGHV